MTDKRITDFLKAQKEDERKLIRQLRGEIVCDFCNDYGYIEICEGIGPEVDCPKCNKSKK